MKANQIINGAGYYEITGLDGNKLLDTTCYMDIMRYFDSRLTVLFFLDAPPVFLDRPFTNLRILGKSFKIASTMTW